MNLTEILAQPDGFTPPGIRVRILRIYDHKSGESEKGPWSFQDIEVEDSSGKGRLKLKNLPGLQADLEGKELILTANQSKQHGLTGMKVSHDQYEGKTYHKIIVTPSAQWTWETNGTKPVATGFFSTAAVAHPPVAQRTGTEWFGAHLVACAQLAVKVADQLGIKSDDARQACFATLCIVAQRRDVILDGQESSKPVQSSPALTQAQSGVIEGRFQKEGALSALPAQRAAISRLCEKLRVGVLPILNDVGCVDETELTREQAGNAIELLNRQIDALT